MPLVVVVLILLAWAVIGIKDYFEPSLPHIEDWDEHMRTLMQFKTPAERRKYLNRLARQSRRK